MIQVKPGTVRCKCYAVSLVAAQFIADLFGQIFRCGVGGIIADNKNIVSRGSIQIISIINVR